MKIISKHKDYYDYLVSYYGFDPMIVYDRRETRKIHFYKPWFLENPKIEEVYLFAICGEFIPVYYNNGEFHFNSENLKLSPYESKTMGKRGQKTDLNTIHRQPVLYVYGGVYIPRLADFGFPSHIDANDMYQRIYAFLGWLKDNPEAPQITDNTQKILAHGFDKRTSFRPKIKH